MNIIFRREEKTNTIGNELEAATCDEIRFFPSNYLFFRGQEFKVDLLIIDGLIVVDDLCTFKKHGVMVKVMGYLGTMMARSK